MSDTDIDPLVEIDAMKSVAEALTPLNEDSCGRVLRWAADRFGVKIQSTKTPEPEAEEEDNANLHDSAQEEKNTSQQFDEIADLYSATTPSNDPEKALIVGYWFQVVQGQNDFDAGRVNKELKHLGHGVTNITTAMTSLIGRKPALAMQTKKSGSSQQARKKYKLTHEGLRKVQEMIES